MGSFRQRNFHKRIYMSNYSSHYSEGDFWEKVKKIARKGGMAVLRPALELYYALKAEDTPMWAKAVAAGALGYFIFPFDLIPDFLPGGFVDDILTMATALTSIGRYVTKDIVQKAKDTAEEWLS
jgi:uncharacterized membrane protein YkvA (DUF1232 family)